MSSSHTGITQAVLDYKAPESSSAECEPVPDRAFYADPEKSSLLSGTTRVVHLTPYIGDELSGLDLKALTNAQKDELALLVAEESAPISAMSDEDANTTKRGVVFFRNQVMTLEEQISFFQYYGTLKGAQMNGWGNKNNPQQVTIGGRNDDIRDFAKYGADFHSDHSYQANPPSYSLLRLTHAPESGGDTIFVSQTALFDKLSPTMQSVLKGLHGVHTNEQAYINAINDGKNPFSGPVRREQPLIRTHQVTKQKSLFYNPTYVSHIKELKGQESIHVLNFLREHVHTADDLSVRWKWEPNSVAMWDNRIVTHRAVPGGYDPAERRGHRTAVSGEKPFYSP